MRTWLKVCLIGAGLMVAWALAPPDAIAQKLAGSDHDFTIGGGGASSLCITCHSPHKAGMTPLLWNHKLATHAGYSWSDATKTTGGTTLPTNILTTWSGSTKMCLSCHDGTVGVGTLYFGSYTYGGSLPPVITNAAGTDLKGNHPVAVPYPYGGLKNTYNTNTTGDLVPLTEYVPTPTKVKIFADPSVATNNRGMECASCHNPHDDTNGAFLRDAKSAFCSNCHIK